MPGDGGGGETPAVFVGNVDSNGDHADLTALFASYGTVNNVDVKKGFAFVFMPDRDEAERAIAGVSGMPYGPARRELRVEWSRGNATPRRRDDHQRRSAPPGNTLFVANFPYGDDTEQKLRGIFEEFGTLVRVDVKDQYAFVQYTDVRDAQRAHDATVGMAMGPRTLKIEFSVRDSSSRTMRNSRQHGFDGPHGGAGYGPGPGYRGPPMYNGYPGGPGGYGGGGYGGQFGGGGGGQYGPPPGYFPPSGQGYHPPYNGYGGPGGPPPRGGYPPHDAGGYYEGGPGPRGRRRDDGSAGWNKIVDERRKRALSPRRSLSPSRGEGQVDHHRAPSPARNGKRARRGRERSVTASPRSRSRTPSPAAGSKRKAECSASPNSAEKRVRRSASPDDGEGGSPSPGGKVSSPQARSVSPETQQAPRSPSPAKSGSVFGSASPPASPPRARSPAGSRDGSRSPAKASGSPVGSRDGSPSPAKGEDSPARSRDGSRSRSGSPASNASRGSYSAGEGSLREEKIEDVAVEEDVDGAVDAAVADEQVAADDEGGSDGGSYRSVSPEN